MSIDSAKLTETNLVNIEDLAGSLLHLTHLVHEVPESGLRHNLITGEELHAVGRRVCITLGRSLAADDLVESHTGGHFDVNLLMNY